MLLWQLPGPLPEPLLLSAVLSAQRLMTIPYVGPITSLALANVMADPALFKNGRQFADYCGETPYHTGSGGKVTILGIARKGNPVLKRSLYEGASGLYNRVKTGIESKTCHYYQSDWILNLVRRKPRKVAICAIANKMCRIAWAVAATENGRYDRTKTSLVSVLEITPLGDHLRRNLVTPFSTQS